MPKRQVVLGPNCTRQSNNLPRRQSLISLFGLYSTADYFFEAIAPFNDSQAIYQVCALTVWYGENIACASVNKFDPQYIITANDTFYTDIARVDLGKPFTTTMYVIRKYECIQLVQEKWCSLCVGQYHLLT